MNHDATYAGCPSRRPARMLSREDCLRLLRAGEWGVLSLAGERGPYGVALNYAARVSERGVSLIFHGSPAGLKMDIIARSPEACFTVVAGAESRPAVFNTRYESVMAFGPVRVLEGEEKAAALRFLGERFGSAYPEVLERELASAGKTAVFCLEAQGLTGKFNPGE